MPRKTKKQKVLSDYRRRLVELEFRTPSSPRAVREAQAKPKHVVPQRREVDEAHLEENKAVIIRDLRKTVALSVVAISAIVVLYFVT
jgi:hypothetical protein